MPSRLMAPDESEARFANRPNKYSVFNSLPLKVRVMSMRPRMSSERSVELMARAWTMSAG